MRMPSHRMGSHPKVRPSSFRAWYLDETNEVNSPCVWSSPGVSQAFNMDLKINSGFGSSDPFIVDTPVGMGRKFIKEAAFQGMALEATNVARDGDAASVAVFDQIEVTFAAWVKVNKTAPDTGNIAALVSEWDTESLASNYLFTLRLQATGNFNIGHEYPTSNNAFYNTAYNYPVNKWFYICITRNDVLGSARYDIYINGRFIESSGSLNAPGGGADAYWQVGGIRGSGGNIAYLLDDVELAGIYTWSNVLSADEIMEDFQRGLLKTFHTGDDLKVYIDNGQTQTSGLSSEEVYVDTTDISGVDFVSSLSVSTSPDDAVVQGSLSLSREQENLSVAYLKNDTKINFSDPSSIAGPRFLDAGRGIKIYAARTPLGITASGRELWSFLDGTIDIFNWGSDEVKVNFRDNGGVLVDTFIEEELEYGSDVGILVATEMQQILDDNSSDFKTSSYESPTLTYDPSINWAIKSFEQRREPVIVALRTLAGQFGHDVKYKWSDALDDFKLTLYQPEADSTTPAIVISPDEIVSVSSAEVALQRIRNVVRVSYDSTETGGAAGTQEANVNSAIASIPFPANFSKISNSAVSAVDGERLPAYVMIQDEDSRDKYGRRFMEVQESSTSHIDLGTEATEMAYRMLTDLSEPEFTHSIKIQLTPEIDIHDIIGFAPNEKLYTERQYLAVSSVSHTFGKDASTSIDVRGKPGLGSRRWLSIESRLANNPANTPMQAQNAMQKTQRANPMQSILENTNWMSGGKFVQVRNSSFSTWTNGKRNPPTSWDMDTGDIWDNDTIRATSTSLTGPLAIAMHEDGGTNPRVDSDLIPLDGDANVPYCLEVTWQRIAGANTSSRPSFFVKWLDAAFNVVSTSGPLEALIPGPGGSAEWHTHRYQGLSGVAGAVYAQINMGANFGGIANEVIVDSVSLYRNAYGSRTTLQTTGDWVSTDFSANVKAGGGLNIRASNVSTAGSYDFGGNWVDDTSTAAGNHNGTYFDVPATGYYDVSGAIYVGITPSEAIPWDYWEDIVFPGGSLQVLFNSHVPPITSTIIPPPPSWTGGVLASINNQYGPTGLLTVFGTALAQTSTTFTIGDNAALNRALPGNPISINMPGLLLTRGDRLSFSLWSVPTALLAYPSTDMDISATGSDFGDLSYISIKFSEND
jgi:hypothetical protein